MSVHNDECLSKILLQLKFQAIILKDYWPLKGLVRSHIFLCLCSIVFIFIRENNWKRFLSYLRVLAQTDYPLHTSLIKLISIIVRPGRGRFECIVFLTSTYSSSSSAFVDFHVRVSLIKASQSSPMVVVVVVVVVVVGVWLSQWDRVLVCKGMIRS